MKKLLLLFPIFFLFGCAEKTYETMTKTEFVFDTAVTVSVYDSDNSDLLDEVFALCKDYENRFSKQISTSEVSILNNAEGKPVEVSDELILMLTEALGVSVNSGGLFDITINPVSELWGFSSLPKIPTDEELEAALATVSYENVVIDGNTVTLLNGAKIDLGGIAKGYIADVIKEYLLDNKVSQAIINIGGNVVTLGLKNGTDKWSVGIQEPFATTNQLIMVAKVEQMSVVTSGPYERNFVYDDVIYHHILNPETGYPCDLDMYSVTIICEDAMLADALSTTCFLLGYEKSIEFLELYPDVEAIFVDPYNEIFVTDGIGDKIEVEYWN